jgi:RHS repeat-associated protein
MVMAGISSKALGTLENKKKYNGIEFENDLDINIYNAFFRELDQQTGRWWQIDPEIENMESWSPYASNFDNPISFNDPLGDNPDCPSCKEFLDGASDFLNKAIISAGSTMNGFLNNVTFGAWPTNPSQSLGITNGYSGNNAQLHSNSVTGGQVLGMGFSMLKGGYNPQFASVSGPKVPITKPISIPAILGSNQLNSNSGDNKKDNTYSRVKPRKSTIEKVKENQPKNDKGQMLDPNTGQVLDPEKTDLGHVPGNEWRTRKEMHKSQGNSRKQILDSENNPDLYQFEDRSNNRSHRHELQKKQ